MFSSLICWNWFVDKHTICADEANIILDCLTVPWVHMTSSQYPDCHACEQMWAAETLVTNPCTFFLGGFMKEKQFQKMVALFYETKSHGHPTMSGDYEGLILPNYHKHVRVLKKIRACDTFLSGRFLHHLPRSPKITLSDFWLKMKCRILLFHG